MGTIGKIAAGVSLAALPLTALAQAQMTVENLPSLTAYAAASKKNVASLPAIAPPANGYRVPTAGAVAPATNSAYRLTVGDLAKTASIGAPGVVTSRNTVKKDSK